MTKPLIYFVEDNEDTQAIFKASMIPDWDFKIFSDPAVAIRELLHEQPTVIISDQELPTMKGDEFLQLARDLSPFSTRVIQTAHADERLLLDSIRKLQLNDFIKKPWTAERMRKRIVIALEIYDANNKYRLLDLDVREKSRALKEMSLELQQVKDQLVAERKQSDITVRELESWTPPAVSNFLRKRAAPTTGDRAVVTLAFSIPADVILPDITVDGRPVRVQLAKLFSDAVLRYGGWKESSGGAGARTTSAYFGLFGETEKISDNALAAAMEFKTSIENLSRSANFQFPCHIAVYSQNHVHVHVRSTLVNINNLPITQKVIEPFGIDYDRIRAMITFIRAINRPIVAVSATLEERLQNRSWGLKEAKPPLAETTPSIFLFERDLSPDESILLLKQHRSLAA